jgi:hypothetical protein
MLNLRSLIFITISSSLVACGGGGSSSSSSSKNSKAPSQENKADETADSTAKCGYKTERKTSSVDLFDADHNKVNGIDSAGITTAKAEYRLDIKDSKVKINEENAKVFFNVIFKEPAKPVSLQDKDLAAIKNDKLHLNLSKLKGLVNSPLNTIKQVSITVQSKTRYRLTKNEIDTIANGTLKCGSTTFTNTILSPRVTVGNELHSVEISGIKISGEVISEIQ